MPELSVADVVAYTGGRLTDDGPSGQTARLLSAALGAARRYCGWRVTPTDTESFTLDGPGGHILALPTMNVVELLSVTEDGIDVDVSTLRKSSFGLVRKPFRHQRWCHEIGSITVVMNHGYDDAEDFNAAVLALVDRMSLAVGTGVGPSANLAEKRVGDVTYRWQETEVVGLLDESLLDPYRLLALA